MDENQRQSDIDIWDDTPIRGFGEDALAEANRRIGAKLRYMCNKVQTEAQKRPSRLKEVLDGRKSETACS